jgi:dipeptidyl aminopeptidase/acylaminoacyl peptidase
VRLAGGGDGIPRPMTSAIFRAERSRPTQREGEHRFSGSCSARFGRKEIVVTLLAGLLFLAPAGLFGETPTSLPGTASGVSSSVTAAVGAAPVDLERDFTLSVPKGLSGRLSFTAKVRGFDRVMVLDLDGRRLSSLVDGPGNNYSGAWSPDGERLVFVSDRDGNKELYLVRWDGSEERRLTTSALNEDQPAWHPNGKSIVFSRESGAGGAESNIFSVTVATGEVRPLTKHSGRNITPRWSPNGETIAFSTNRFWPGWRIMLLNSVRGGEEFVSKAEGMVISQPVYSVDGQRIYFANNTPGGNAVQMFKLADRTLVGVRQGDGRHVDPAPSPDDLWVVFAYAEPGTSDYALFVIERRDRSIKPLLSSIYSVRHPSWSGVKAIALEAAKAREFDAANEGPPLALPSAVPSDTPAP